MTATKRAKSKPSAAKNRALKMAALAPSSHSPPQTASRHALESKLWELTVGSLIDKIGELQTELIPHAEVKKKFDRLDSMKTELRKLLELRPAEEIATHRGAAHKAMCGAKTQRKHIGVENLKALHVRMGNHFFDCVCMTVETLERETKYEAPMYYTVSLTGPREIVVTPRNS